MQNDVRRSPTGSVERLLRIFSNTPLAPINPPYRRCPHYPRKRTWETRTVMSVLGQMQTHAPQQDHP
jgi:hypothetical protein